MKLLRATEKSATVELAEGELWTIMAALSLHKPEADQATTSRDLVRDLAGALEAIRASRDRPFEPGQRVEVSLLHTGPAPDLADGQAGVVISVHDEDETRDYPHCTVKLDDGRELELPQFMLIRA